MLLYLILIHHQTTTLSHRTPSSYLLYLILIHHQTTTQGLRNHSLIGCISSLFITKPQLRAMYTMQHDSCISSLFITKPQLHTGKLLRFLVVSHPYSSPNHNGHIQEDTWQELYLILIHHQTTTLY